MADCKWGPDFTFRDNCKTTNLLSKNFSYDVVPFYNYMLKLLLGSSAGKLESRKLQIGNGPSVLFKDTDIASSLRDVVTDYLYEMYGRPKWFVDKTTFNLLNTISLDSDDLSGIIFPHDVFSLVFEHGVELEGFPLRNIRVYRRAASMTTKFLNQLEVEFTKSEVELVNLMIDTGEVVMSNNTSWDTPPYLTRKWNWSRPLKDPEYTLNFATTLSAQEKNVVARVSKIVASALMYKAARPDLVPEYVLPRSQRYSFKGDKRTYRRILAPQAPPGREYAPNPTGREVRGHYRGWVLRTLRHEKYKRNADGSFKTVLVEPVAVKGGPSED